MGVQKSLCRRNDLRFRRSQCFSVLLVAFAVIFFINFVIISLYDGVWPGCHFYYPWGDLHYPTINFWEGIWMPIPSFVTGIIGMTTACGPSQCKKWALLVFAILTTLFNLTAFAPLVVSFIDNECVEARESYLLIQIGLVFLSSITSFTPSILTCLYTPTKKTIQGTVLPSVQVVSGAGQQQQPVVYVMQQQPHQEQQQHQPHQQQVHQQQQQQQQQLQPQGEAQPE